MSSLFQLRDDDHTLLGLPYCPGGELYSLFKNNHPSIASAKAKEEAIVFYAANVMIGLHYLHQVGIVYQEYVQFN